MIATAKVVTRGRSQSVELPRKFRLPGKTVQVRTTADGLLLSPEKRDPEKLRRALAKLAGSCPDFPLREPVQGTDVPRDLDW